MTLIGNVGRWHGRVDSPKDREQRTRELVAAVGRLTAEVKERQGMLTEYRKQLRALCRASQKTTKSTKETPA